MTEREMLQAKTALAIAIAAGRVRISDSPTASKYNRTQYNSEWMRHKRAKLKEKGMTTKGQPRKRAWTPHGLSKNRAEYMRWWRRQRKAK